VLLLLFLGCQLTAINVQFTRAWFVSSGIIFAMEKTSQW